MKKILATALLAIALPSIAGAALVSLIDYNDGSSVGCAHSQDIRDGGFSVQTTGTKVITPWYDMVPGTGWAYDATPSGVGSDVYLIARYGPAYMHQKTDWTADSSADGGYAMSVMWNADMARKRETGYVRMYLYFTDNDAPTGNVIESYTMSAPDVGTGWHQASIAGILPTPKADGHVGMVSIYADENVAVDNVYVAVSTSVPEPAAALLGLAGLALLLRRKRV
jgi:MYXO-CTERM domain-containing protein